MNASIVHKDLFPMFNLSDEKINILAIENPYHYYSFVSELNSQISGENGLIVLSSDDKLLKLSSTIELITQFVPFEINNKKLINKLYSFLSTKTQMSENYERMLQINNAVCGFISSIGFDENLDIDFNSSVDLSLLFKSVDLRFSDDGKSLSEKLIDYITYIRELEGDKIFVFVNLLMFVSYEERELFFQTIIDHRFTVLLLEGIGVSVSENVNQIIIDNDLCVI